MKTILWTIWKWRISFQTSSQSAALRHPKGRRCLYPRRRVCLKGGDKAAHISRPKDAYLVLKKLNIYKSIAKSVMIIGGSKIAFVDKRAWKAWNTCQNNWKRRTKCVELSEQLNAEIVIGDGSDREVLIEEGLLGCDAVIILALTKKILWFLFCFQQKSKNHNKNQPPFILFNAGCKRHREHNLSANAYRQSDY